MTRSRRDTLPIAPLLPKVAETLDANGAAVLVAETGAGKTTRVPPALLAARGGSSRIVMLEPRRIAARAAATRIAFEGGWQLGEEVGYQIRFEGRWGSATRIVVVTEGTLLAMLQRDPMLESIGTLVFDEFHERSLDADLALAMARRVQQDVRPDLRLLVMSATLDAAPVARFLGDCPVVHSTGRSFPVTLEHATYDPDRPLHARVSAGVRQALSQCDGDVLVFLPGVGEIRRAAEVLEADRTNQSITIVPLHGNLDGDQQDIALRAGPRRKIVLATNVAETSVTVDGVDAVVDSGLARTLRFDPTTGLDRLELGRISVASADQRMGRAGRQRPGYCLRLWSAHDHRSLPAHGTPEIRRIDITGALLQLMAWGERDPAAFDWFEAPAPAVIARGTSLLEALGAVGSTGVTVRGQQMARLPLHPRLARLVVAGHEAGALDAAARAAALLAERDVVQRPRDGRPPRAAYATDSDLMDRLDAIQRLETGGYAETALGPVSRSRARFVIRAARQIAQQARRILGAPQAAPDLDTREAIGRAVLAAYPDRVARRRSTGEARAVMVGGRGVRLSPSSSVRDAELVVCLALDDGRSGERREAWVRMASAIDESWLKAAHVRHVTTETTTTLDPDLERVVAHRETRFHDLVLRRVACSVDPAEAERVLLRAARAQPERALALDEPSVAGFLTRVKNLAHWMPELDLPAFDAERLSDLLPSLVTGRRSFEDLRRAPLLPLLQGALSFEQLRALDREAPERITVPSGNAIRLRYEPNAPPVLAVRIQELFGLAETPRVASGRTPVLLHLLAPNRRPQQITQDLVSFWENTYPEVRKELAGRYPKHAWPLDPRTATAERRPKRRRSR